MKIDGMQFHSILSPAEARGLDPEQRRRWLRALGRKHGVLLPVMGGDGEEDEGGAGGGGEAGGESGDDETSAGGDDEDDESEDDSEDADDDNDDETKDRKTDVAVPRSEYERLKRVAREHDAERRRREKDQKKADEKRRKEQGQYEELLQEKDEQIRATEGERDEARYQLDAFKRRVRVTEAAKRLNFKDPEDAFRFLSDEDTEDETSTERALKRLAKQKAYLVSERRPTGAPVNGEGATLTSEQLKNLSPDEVNKNWPEVQKALANQ